MDQRHDPAADDEPQDTRLGVEPALLPPLFEGPSVAMISTDVDGKVLAVSPSASALLGYSEAELVGSTLHQRVHYQQRDGTPLPVERCPISAAIRATRAAAGDGETLTRKDGGLVEISWAVAPIVIAGEGTGAIVAFYDTVRVSAVSREVEARAVAVEVANVRLALLADASHALLSASNLRRGLARMAQVLIPVAADWVVLDLLDERAGRVERAALAHVDHDLQQRGQALLGSLPRLAPGMTNSFATVLRGGPTTHLTTFPPVSAAEDELEAARLELFHLLGTAEAITAPLRTRTRAVGAITLVRRDPRQPYEAADVQLVGELATRAAFAVENAMLLEQFEGRAESLQRALLPEVPDRLGDVRLAHLYRPTDDLSRVGGDWYDAFTLADGSTALVIGDVAGHDVLAATRMGAIRHKLRGIAGDRLAPPSEVLTRLDAVVQHLNPDDLATIIYGRLTPVAPESRPPSPGCAWTLEWSNAGHPPPLFLAPQGGALLLQGPSGPPIGVTTAERADERLVLPAGSTLVLYTDGLVERADEAIDVGLARLVERADRLAPRRPGRLVERLPHELVGLVRPPAVDDIAVLVVHLPDAASA